MPLASRDARDVMSPDQLRALVRSIPDFPRPGHLFRDVTTLIGHGEGFAAATALLAEAVRATGVWVVAGIEARGFIFGAAVAAQLGLPFVPVRKPGKLPVPVLAMDYALEYGTDTLEIDPGSVRQGMPVSLVDDLIATGGTARAAAKKLRQAAADVRHALFVIDLPDLGGAQRLRGDGLTVASLMDFPGPHQPRRPPPQPFLPRLLSCRRPASDWPTPALPSMPRPRPSRSARSGSPQSRRDRRHSSP